MSLHRPGLPEELPDPELLWARWAAIAVVTAQDPAERGRYPTGCWLDGGGLHFDDCGCTWWTLVRAGDGRAVLYGEDESSDVKWHKPPIDMLAGAPDWLPHKTLRDLLEGYELGCVYWYENGAWARAPYPASLADDGLDCGMARFATLEDAAAELAGYLDGEVDDQSAAELLAHAEQHTLTRELLDAFRIASGNPDGATSAMAADLRRSGLDGGVAVG
ncbi:hypothetical protein [Streptomyces sp. NPDC048650]|uniref:hypothetical protein n=1 Tax=Streptomyces sp. NPDC048650 TaxID=3365583 RepID=UPI00371FA0D9